MTQRFMSVRSPYLELLFQVVLHLVVFVFYSFDKHEPRIEVQEVAFFINYAIGAFIINYVLLRYFYAKQYLLFVCLLFLVLTGVILAEEFFLEKIFYPKSRGLVFNGYFMTLLDVIPVITILSGFKFAWDAIRIKKEVDVLKETVRESELQFLKSQINPHFLFNNLNNLYSYAIEQSPKTPTIILELSAVLRYMLYECKEKYVPLTKEIEQLKNFTKLNQLQIEERGEVHFNARHIKEGYKIAPLILSVFIENAFKHSTASQSDQIFIDISIQLSNSGELFFVCKNSFLPQSNTDNLPHGIGLKNVKKRLQLLYPDAHQLDITSENNEFIVQLSLQLSNTSKA